MGTPIVISVENLSKHYRLGVIGGGTLREDVSGWLAKLRGHFGATAAPGETNGAYPPRGNIWALRDIDLEVREGEILGIIGHNGAGKSTLLKILSRITAPTSGRAVIHGRVGSLLEVGTGFHPELTGRENIYLNGAILGMSRAEVTRKLDEIVAFAEVEKFVDTPVKRYSSGMTVRLAFAVAAHLEPEILIVDEVLAVGDLAFQRKCLGKMDEVASVGRAILFVSHNLDAVKRLCTRGVTLANGRLDFAGTASEVVEHYIGTNAPSHTHEPIVLVGPPHDGYDILRIELLDELERPLNRVRTWDAVVFRIVFRSPVRFKGGAVELQIATMNGTVLFVFSTQPDRQSIVNFNEGLNRIDCVVPRLMLAAGKYRIGAALSIPNVRWLVNKLDKGFLDVATKDVYHSGLAPNVARYVIPCDYRWREVPDPVAARTGPDNHSVA